MHTGSEGEAKKGGKKNHRCQQPGHIHVQLLLLCCCYDYDAFGAVTSATCVVGMR